MLHGGARSGAEDGTEELDSGVEELDLAWSGAEEAKENLARTGKPIWLARPDKDFLAKPGKIDEQGKCSKCLSWASIAGRGNLALIHVLRFFTVQQFPSFVTIFFGTFRDYLHRTFVCSCPMEVVGRGAVSHNARLAKAYFNVISLSAFFSGARGRGGPNGFFWF